MNNGMWMKGCECRDMNDGMWLMGCEWRDVNVGIWMMGCYWWKVNDGMWLMWLMEGEWWDAIDDVNNGMWMMGCEFCEWQTVNAKSWMIESALSKGMWTNSRKCHQRDVEKGICFHLSFGLYRGDQWTKERWTCDHWDRWYWHLYNK